MMALRYAWRALTRSPQRTLAGVSGIVIAVGLLSSVLLYVGSSARGMTQRTIATVPVDMRASALSYGLNMKNVARVLGRQPGVVAVQPLTMSYFRSAGATQGGQIFSTGTGNILALNPQYLQTFPAIKLVQGHLGSDGVVISQDMGTNLGVRPGNTVVLHLPGRSGTYRARVVGIADMKKADILFAPTDPRLAGTPFNPPANVVIMPLATFDAKLASRLQSAPPMLQSSALAAGAVVQGSTLAVNRELHLRIDHSILASDPSQAEIQTGRLRLALEKFFPGELRITDNLAAAIAVVKNDVLWAQILFVFLAVPGVLLAVYLSHYAALALLERQRREFALLRTRGASSKQVLSIVAATSAFIGITGALLGLAVGVGTTMVLFGTDIFALSNWRLWGSTLFWCALLGLVIAALSSLVPARQLLQRDVIGERRLAQRDAGRPLWVRLYLDIVALVLAAAIFKLTQGNGFHPVLNAEGNPTLTLSILTFLGPFLFWVGAVLLLIRLGTAALRGYTRGLSWVLRSAFGRVGDFAAMTASRRARAMSSAAILIALALSFGSSVSIFASTYKHQQTVDAGLTLGADVKVEPRAGHQLRPALANQIQRVQGVQAVSPFRSTLAYVGTEIQTMFGVDVRSLQRSATLSDTFFQPANSQATMDKLAATPDGILISSEMSRDYSIFPGDHVRIRLFNRTAGQYQTTRFTVVGVALEFPTAPKDAFLVVNLKALMAATSDPTVNAFLVRSSDDPATVATRVDQALGAGQTRVQSIATTNATLVTSLATLNLSALTRIEYGYSALIASAGLAIFLLALLAERRREFATMRALGTTGRQLSAFVISEAGLIGLGGLLVGLLIGAIHSAMLVTILTSIFDPPPGGPIPDYGLLFILIGLCAVGLLAAIAFGIIRLGAIRLGDALRHE